MSRVPDKIYMAGIFAKEVSLGQITVAAGQTNASIPIQDVSDADQIILGVVPDTSHTYSGILRFFANDGVTGFGSSEQTVLTSASNSGRVSNRTSTMAPKVQIKITNGDATSHTYTVYLYKFGNKIN